MKNKKLISTILLVTFMTLLVVGSSFAFWVWGSSQNTNVSFTVSGKNFSCNADGGGNITSNDIVLEPARCTNASKAIKREITTSITNGTSGSLLYELYLNINSIDSELASSTNFKWVISNSSNSCDGDNVISTGNFNRKVAGDKAYLTSKVYDASDTDSFYLYIWLDEAETDPNTADKTFDFSLGGECSDNNTNVPNPPEINNSGLIPVKLSLDGSTVTAISEDDPSWYNYYNKKWANAVLTTSTNRSSYQNLSTGQEVNIPTSEILAYYVWIPRYSYKVWQYSGYSSEGQEREIDIKFVSTTVKNVATANGQWYTPLGFTFGDTELSGIWVGKFEISHQTLSINNYNTTANNLGTDSGTICNEMQCNNYTGIRTLPNVRSLVANRISNFFNVSRFMETTGNPFGLVAASIDSHIIKNSEWGVIIYLAHSRFGINGDVTSNNHSLYNGRLTGCGASVPKAGGSSTCENKYGTKEIYPQSTTGNVTGIFDMSGLNTEFVMGHWGVATTYGSSGFSDTYPLPNAKYYDNYSSTVFTGNWSDDVNLNKCTLETCGGHALNEVRNWYGYRIVFTNSTNPWFNRGDSMLYPNAASMFVSNSTNGSQYIYRSSRLVLTPE